VFQTLKEQINSLKLVLLTLFYDFWPWLIQINYKMKTKFNGILTLLLAFVVQLTFAQEKTISGTVVDETNMPLPGATVVIKGTTTGASTDIDGKYTINANTGDVLTFSYVGYSEQSATIGSETTIDIALSLDNSLEEVVVTAIGVKRKQDEITTANQVVKAEELTQASNPDVVQSLAGKVSGLQINTTSNGLNPNTTITLRGTRSISGNNSALVVIDNIVSTSGILSSLDPNTIESVNVIKGANGAALYGELGSAGVIIVTTKKGSKNNEKFTVEVKSSATFEEIAYLPETQNRYGQGWSGELDWTDQGSWGPEYDGSSQVIGIPYPGANDWKFSAYEHIEDNIKPFFQTGTNYQNSVSIASGTLDTGYVNLSILRQDIEGIIPNNSRSKNNFSLTTGKKAGKFSLQAVARYTEDKNDQVNGNLYRDLSNTPSNIDIERFNSGNNADHWTLYADSPYWLLENDRSEGRTKIYDFSADIKYDFNEHINVILRSSVRNTNSTSESYTNEYLDLLNINDTERGIRSNYSKSLNDDRRIYTDFLVNFDYNLTDDITFKSNVGLNATDRRFQSLFAGGNDLRLENFYDLSNISNVVQYGESKLRKRTAGVFAQIDLGYKDYLFLNATGRNDWNSVLPTDNNSFFYPSVGVAFVATKAFPSLKGKILNKAKFSGSWVKTGNASALGSHTINYVAPQAGGQPYFLTPVNSFLLETSTVDPNIKNEFITSTEFNANLEFLKRRITLDGSISFGENKDQLLNITSSAATGFTSSLINVGETKTNGIEIDLGFTPIKTDDFEWNGAVGYSAYKTTVEKVTDQSDIVNTAGGLSAVVGEEFPVIRGTAYTRDDEGRVVLDAAGNPIRSSSLEILGKTTPDYILNFSTSFRYKNLRLSAVADYRTGHVFRSGVKQQLSYQGRTIESAEGGRRPFLYPNSTIDGSGVTNTSVLTGSSNANGAMRYYQNNYDFFDENFIVDASAFKLREVSLNYDLPSKFASSLNMSRFTIGASARNILTILPKDNRDYNDPEFGNGVSSYNFTPPTQFYTFMVNIAF